MKKEEKTILITGATGIVGTELVKQLVEKNQKVRVLVRDTAKAKMKFGTTVEIVEGDLSKPETLDAAFAGVDKAFILSVGDIPMLEGNAYKAAKKSGVNHIVKLSGGTIEADYMAETPFVKMHKESERQLRALGISWTILRPGPFNSNLLNAWGIIPRGGLFLPSGNGKDAHIDPLDISAVAAKVLTTSGHEGKIYELTGPELLSYGEVVEKVAAVTGKPLKFVDVPEATWRKDMLAAGVPSPAVESFVCYMGGVKAGRMYLTPTVEELLGRPARTFDEWAQNHVAELQ